MTDNLKKDSADDRNFDALFTNDDLGRLIRARSGKLVTGSITKDARDEQWMDGSGNSSLTQTGNWGRYRLNLNSGSDSDYTDTNELDDTRAHSVANELSTRDTDSNSSVNYTLAYDAAGNMTSDGNEYGRYTYDAFGRMRKAAKNSDGSGLVAEYRYNGLGMKLGWHYDADNDNDVDGSDPWYYFCFDEKWQAITTFRGSDSDAKERFIYHTAGLDGTGSASYIDDVVLIDADVNSGWTSAADSTKEVRRYYLQNWRHDVVAILSDGGKLIQNIAYLAYGKAYGLPAGDRDGSGTWTSADATAISGYGGSYRVDYDTDLDGDIDAADVTWANAITGGYYDLGLDRLSSSSVFNRRGYAGYEHAWELDGTKYHVRHRVLDSELGRWNRRDPLGYVDGMSMYEYVADKPITGLDPSGTVQGCVIEIQCNNVPLSPFGHCYILHNCDTTEGAYGGEIGERRACRAGPRGFGGGGPSTAPCKPKDGYDFGPSGPLKAGCAPWDSNFPDYVPDRSLRTRHPTSVAPQGSDPNELARCIEKEMRNLNCCKGYSLFGPNSNSAVHTALDRCGAGDLKPPKDGGPTPGWNTIIPRGECIGVAEQ